MAINTGSRVRQIVPVIEGVVTRTQWNEAANAPERLVTWTDEDGEKSRWFLDAELQEVVA